MRRPAFITGLVSGIAVASLAKANIAEADIYPSRPITLIVPWGAGGGSDQMARAVANVMQDALKNASVPVINVPGSDGNNGMVKLVEADADGYTVAEFASDTFYGNITSKNAPPWQLKDIIPLAVMNRQPFTFFANGNSSYKSWSDIEKASKVKQIKIAIDGFGSAEEVLVQYFVSKGLKLVSIPFAKAGERYAALLGDQVDLMCDPDGNVRRYVEAKQILPLIVFSTKRVGPMPGVPTAFELGYKVALGEWRAIVVKAGTSPDQVKILSGALEKVYKSPDFQDFLKKTWSEEDSYVDYKGMAAFMGSKDTEIRGLIASIH
jgi:tripartite-type tricarboxylate transporter receptor subunit TctC